MSGYPNSSAGGIVAPAGDIGGTTIAPTVVKLNGAVPVTSGNGAPSGTPTGSVETLYVELGTQTAALWLWTSNIGGGGAWIMIGGITQSDPGNGGGVSRSSSAYVADYFGGPVTLKANNIITNPASSSQPTLAYGTAYQNTLGYDILITVVLSITANTSGVWKLGVGSTNTPAQQTIITGLTATGIVPISFYLPNSYYALLSVSGTQTSTIDGQIATAI